MTTPTAPEGTTIRAHHTHTHTSRCWWKFDEASWVCRPAEPQTDDPAAEAPTASERPLVDVRDMIVVHTALLREFRLAPAAVARVAVGDRKRAAATARHLDFLAGLLHHHHEGEDTLLWPLLQQRLPATALDALRRVEDQHAAIDTALQQVSSARADWLAAAGAAERDALVDALSRLFPLLDEHLEHEESAVLPWAAAVLSEAEWGAVGAAAAAAMSKPDLVLAIGMFAYEGDPDVLRTMLASAPAVPRLLVPRIGPRVYARRARAVHGTARP